MSDSISRQDAVNEIHKYFVEEIDKTPTEIDEDGDELYADMPTVNYLLACNKELSKRIKSLPSADRPTGEVDAVAIYEKAEHDLEHNKITLGEYEKRIEPLKHLYYDRPTGEWIIQDTSYWRETHAGPVQVNRVNLKCSNCGWKNHKRKYYNYCPNCGARMRGEEE